MLLTFWKQLLTVEKLPPPPPRPASPQRVKKAARWLFLVDELGRDPQDPPRTGERGILSALFGLEPLPLDPPEPPRPAGRYLRWFIGPESLDETPPPDGRSSKH